jgi:hypothetical protein
MLSNAPIGDVTVPPSSPYAMLSAASLADLKKDKTIQTFIVGVLFLAWAFGYYAPQWNGTWMGLLAVLAGAFSVDVATDSLMAKIK